MTAKLLLCLLIISLGYVSCKQKHECGKMIYELPKVHCDSIAERLLLEKFEKVIVEIDHGNETTYLCFQSINDSDSLYNELYNNTNRFLKISDSIHIPAITKEDILLMESKYVLNRTGCSFSYRASVITE